MINIVPSPLVFIWGLSELLRGAPFFHDLLVSRSLCASNNDHLNLSCRTLGSPYRWWLRAAFDTSIFTVDACCVLFQQNDFAHGDFCFLILRSLCKLRLQLCQKVAQLIILLFVVIWIFRKRLWMQIVPSSPSWDINKPIQFCSGLQNGLVLPVNYPYSKKKQKKNLHTLKWQLTAAE